MDADEHRFNFGFYLCLSVLICVHLWINFPHRILILCPVYDKIRYLLL